MATGGLKRWFKENWVDLSRPKPGGGFEPCGRPDASEGKYPKCVPASRAARMTQAEIDSAVRRKRRAESTQRREGQKPIMVPTKVEKHGSHDQSSHGKRSGRQAAGISSTAFDKLVGEKTQIELRRTADTARIGVTALTGREVDPKFATRPGQRIGDTDVGSILWSTKTGVIEGIRVTNDYQRRGVATALLATARQYAKQNGLPDVIHSDKQTADGAAWAASIGKHGSHDQSSHGNRGPKSQSAAALARRLKPTESMVGANTPPMLAKLASEGGFTWNPKRNERRSKGVVVAIAKEYEEKFPAGEFDANGADIITDYARRHSEKLSEPGIHLGAWLEKGEVYLDLSTVEKSVSAAADIGRANDQIGLFDLGTFTTWYRHRGTSGEFRYLPTPSISGYGTLAVDAIGKALKGVLFVAGTDVTAETIPMIAREIMGKGVQKDSPTVSDVHVATIMNPKKKKKAMAPQRPFVMSKKEPLKDPKGGLTAAGRAHFKRTEGANLKPGVRGPANTPEKMRRKGSFLTRFFTNPSGPMVGDNGKPTRLALSAAAWGEPVPKNRSDAAELAAKGRRLLERYNKVKKHASHDQSTHAPKGKAGTGGGMMAPPPSARAKKILSEAGERIELSSLGIKEAPRTLRRTANITRDSDAIWERAKPTKVSWKDEFLGTEGSVKTKHVKKVVMGDEPLREGYPPRLYELPGGAGKKRYLIADGHHRLAMHSLMESTAFDAVVLPYPMSRGRSRSAQWLGKRWEELSQQ